MSKKMSSGTLENCIQEGHQVCLRRFIILSVFVACELDCLVCSAGVIKPFYSGTPDAMADFQNLFGKMGIVLQFHLPENELMCRRGFNSPAEQFDVTTEPLALGTPVSDSSEFVAEQENDKTAANTSANCASKIEQHAIYFLSHFLSGVAGAIFFWAGSVWLKRHRERV